jgi:hypothetical protein
MTIDCDMVGKLRALQWLVMVIESCVVSCEFKEKRCEVQDNG